MVHGKFEHGPGIPIEIVRKHYNPMYEDLASGTSLRKCLFGKMQNQNEDGIVWEKVLKIHYTALEKLEFWILDTIANFNYGRKTASDTLCKLKVNPGLYTFNRCN